MEALGRNKDEEMDWPFPNLTPPSKTKLPYKSTSTILDED